MLKRDDELRLSDATQRAYSKCEEAGDLYQKIRVTEAVQRQVCREFGFGGNIKEGLEVMRCATAMFPNDAEVQDSCHYLRHNIHVPCPIQLGALVPDVPLYELDGHEQHLHSMCDAFDGPTLVLAGSVT